MKDDGLQAGRDRRYQLGLGEIRIASRRGSSNTSARRIGSEDFDMERTSSRVVGRKMMSSLDRRGE